MQTQFLQRSPSIAGREPPLQKIPSSSSIGDFGGSGYVGAASNGPDGLPEQKIFPGVVHERAHRSSIMNQVEDQGQKQLDGGESAG